MFDYEYWDQKTVLITGGTGSFGKAFLNACLNSDAPVAEIRVFSRDEKKQHDMKVSIDGAMRNGYYKDGPRVKFIVGDVRDREAVDQAMDGVDCVFHAAALKHVPTGEFYPMEVVKTNIFGSNNVIESAIAHGVKKVVVLSTDKAVEATCAMGMAKGLMEKCALFRCFDSYTEICVTRFGNVMGSRGSVIPLFADQIRRGVPVTITDFSMYRYMMTMEQAIEQVVFAFEQGHTGDTIILNTKMASVADVAQAVWRLENPATTKPMPAYTLVGIRPGEKLRERLMTDEEVRYAYSNGKNIYIIPKVKLKPFQLDMDDPLLNPGVLSVDELMELIADSGVLEE